MDIIIFVLTGKAQKKRRSKLLIRDAIHLDIEVNNFEKKIIRTKEINRLYSIKQLGSTYFIYPSAVHTRFEHSLGTFFMAKKIMNSIAKWNEFEFDEKDKKIIPVLALLHDISHVPFGHTFEEDFQLIRGHDTPERIRKFINGEEISSVLKEEFSNEEIDEIVEILSDGESHKLQRPYLSEIIGDTICADLLDYLKRDVYFTGLKREYDERILKYFNIKSYNGKNHLILMLSEEGIRCSDVITEVENLIKIRYILAERVYCYHSKIVADTMLGRAFEALELKEDYIEEKGDEEFLRSLLEDSKKNNEFAYKLIRSFKERKLYTEAYMLNRDSFKKGDGIDQEELSEFFVKYRNIQNCKRAEEHLLTSVQGAKEGDILIFCHNLGMKLKAAEILVEDEDGKIDNLYNFPWAVAINSIVTQHQNLWRFYVFSKIELLDKVANQSEKYFKKPNVIKQFLKKD